MTNLRLHLSRASTLLVVLLAACDGKDGVLTDHTTNADVNTGSETGKEPATTTSATDGEPGTTTTATDGEPGTTTTATDGEPGTTTTATDGEPGTTSATDGEPGTTTSATDGEPGTTGGDPPSLCDAQLTEQDCAAVPPPDGFFHQPCAWTDIEAWDGDAAACGELTGVSRCIEMRYAGEGCGTLDTCANERLYYREVAPGSFEAFAHPTTCGLEPEGWQQCFDGGPGVCDCFCDSAVP